jgi:hypothetical protein
MVGACIGAKGERCLSSLAAGCGVPAGVCVSACVVHCLFGVQSIRKATIADSAALFHVCLATGNAGDDGTHLYPDDPDALGAVRCWSASPLLFVCPTCFVCDVSLLWARRPCSFRAVLYSAQGDCTHSHTWKAAWCVSRVFPAHSGRRASCMGCAWADEPVPCASWSAALPGRTFGVKYAWCVIV